MTPKHKKHKQRFKNKRLKSAQGDIPCPESTIIRLKHKSGRVFEGTALQCAEEMKEGAERSRLAYEDYGQWQPLPPHWLFEEFCQTNSLDFRWYRSTHFEKGFYVISEKYDPHKPT